MWICFTGLKLIYGNNVYRESIFLDCTFVVFCYYCKVAAFQFFSTFDKAFYFPLFCFRATHIITYLYQLLYVCCLT